MNLFNILNFNFFINLALEIIFAISSTLFLQNFSKIKFTLKHNIICVLSNSLCFTFGALFGNYIFSYLLMLICSILIFYFIQKISINTIIGFYSICSSIALNVCYIFSIALSITSYQQIIAMPIWGAIFLLVVVLFELSFYFFIKQFKNNSLFENSIHEKSNLIIILSTINLIFTFSITYFGVELIIQEFIYILGIDLIFCALLTIVIDSCYMEYTKQIINNLKLCNEATLNACDETRAFKHDFHNIIQAIGGYILINDMEGLKKYYKQIKDDCIVSNNFINLTPELVNNPAIYNILVDKYYIARNNNIKINLNVMLDLNKLNINIYELTRILGILLDNAIEASKECNEKNINISFKSDNKKQILIIENTYNNKQISIDKIFEKDYTTKPHNTGLGLWEVRRILNKNTNLNLYTSKNNLYFNKQLEIYSI